MYFLVLKTALLLVLIIVQVQCASVTGPKCKQITCKPFQYCSPHHEICLNCLDICAPAPKEDKEMCDGYCQDYTQALKCLEPGNNCDSNIREDVDRLQKMVTINLSLLIVTLVSIFSLLIFLLIRYKIKKNITLASIKNQFSSKSSKNHENELKSSNNGTATQQEPRKPEMRLQLSTTTVGANSDHSPVTMTTSISRKPAEDSALDYAYDNPAMTATPSPR